MPIEIMKLSLSDQFINSIAINSSLKTFLKGYAK